VGQARSDNAPVEPISSSAAGLFRTTPGASNSEGAGLLRDGKIVQAEVLSQRADGTLVLSIGRHTVPAESELRLDVGTRFAAEVEGQGEEVVLRLLVDPPGEGEGLLSALRKVVGDGRPLGELLFEAAGALRARSELAPPLARLLAALRAQVADPALGAEGLRQLLAHSGVVHEATLAAVLLGRAGRPELERARADLKARLLAGLDGLNGEPEDSPLRQALTRALEGIEAEQLTNLARERSGEGWLVSFPVADGERWATARLLLHEREARAGEEREALPQRLTLGLELSALGPVRADFALAPGVLAVRLTLVRPEVLGWMEAARARLERAFSDGQRALQLVLRLGSPEEAERGLRPLEARYLIDHHLMSVDG